ncbi:UDP-N-acetylmuramyl pentapeptide phosphotransferase [Caldanaerobacter subterraneus KAk]|uniref:UDP-N-acetylmuramyl pentapeptide phosphotransferase n=1 Tax=Caldanaerobacter subterraneus TaxID=911092 RepID=UPI0032C0B428
MKWIVLISIPLIVTFAVKKFFRELLYHPYCLKENYKKKLIPVCGGIVFVPSFFASIFLINLLGHSVEYQEVILIALSLISFVGFADDLIGDTKVKGLKGHILRLIKGKPTTGSLKALGGLLIAAFVSYEIAGISLIEVTIDSLIIALFTNLLNLLDLRPGRCAKGFLLLSLLFLLIGRGKPEFLFILFVIVLVYLPEDLKAQLMMGDTGSNVLGMASGIAAILLFNFYEKLIILFALILFHLFTEKYSLTAIIEKNKFLNYLDMLGRKGEE